MGLLVLASILFFAQSFAQAPQVVPGAIVNAASYSGAVAPGSIASIFGTNLAAGPATGNRSSLPVTLNGTSVSVNGAAAVLLYVSPGQINFVVPSSFATSLNTYSSTGVAVTTPSGSSATVPVNTYSNVPAFFTVDGSGCGQAAVLNIAPDGTRSLNSPANSAAPGDYLELYGTGFGPYLQADRPAVYFNSNSFSPLPATAVMPVYAGDAPGLAGVNQVDVQIPAGTVEGCAVPVNAWVFGPISQTVTVSIHSGRGPCVSPPANSYGQILLTRTVAQGTASDGETDTISASFPSGPSLPAPTEVATAPGLGYIANNYSASPAPNSRPCPAMGQSLSAGPIQVQPSNGAAGLILQPGAYQQALPAGYIQAGQYAFSAAGSSAVGAFQATLKVDAPIQMQTPLPVLNPNAPFTVRWTGGTAGDKVMVSLYSGSVPYQQFDYGSADASAGSFTFNPVCSGNPVSAGGNGVVCSFGIPLTPAAQVVIQVSPPATTSISVPGITGSVQLAWLFRYVFGNVTQAQ
jgi:uncharacterized protein (TIGR03437 family)